MLLNQTSAGSSTASFGAQALFTVDSGPVCIAVADWNSDGAPDLTVGSIDTGLVSILVDTTTPGSSTPTFAPKLDFSVGQAPALVIADFNGDGKLDLATSGNGAELTLNSTPAGAQSPTFASPFVLSTGAETEFLATADFNGDGKPDLVVTNATTTGPTLSVFLSQ